MTRSPGTPGATRSRSAPVGALLAVFAGGVLGTALRLGLDAAIPHADDAFPVSTLVINVVGSFVLGALVARAWPVVSPRARAALGPGLLGSFTTFSAVVVSLVGLRDDLPLAALYLGCTVVLGFGAAAAGLALGGRAADASHSTTEPPQLPQPPTGGSR